MNGKEDHSIIEIRDCEAYGKFEPLTQSIILNLPKDMIENETVKAYNNERKTLEFYDMLTLTLELLDHETLHKIIADIEGILTSAKLDNTNIEELEDNLFENEPLLSRLDKR
jgi:NAD-dependent SIR2 family protein deacetylase